MTRSSSICKTLPADTRDEAHEKNHHNTTAADQRQQNCDNEEGNFPIHLSSTAEYWGGRKDGKMEQHENYSIKCDDSLI